MTALNVSLGRGWTNLSLTGSLVSNNATVTAQLIGGYLGGLWMNVTAQGVALPSSIPLYAGVIPAVRLPASLPPSAVPLVAGVAVSGMFLAPDTETIVGVDLNATVSCNNPLGPGSPIVVRAVAMDVQLQGQGETIGLLHVPWTNVPQQGVQAQQLAQQQQQAQLVGNGDGGGSLINVSLALDAALDISTTAPAFGAFISAFLYADVVSIGLYGPTAAAMSVTIDCALGHLTVSVPVQVREGRRPAGTNSSPLPSAVPVHR